MIRTRSVGRATAFTRVDFDVWTKPLSNGRIAVNLFNRSWDNRHVSVDLADIGFKNGASLRDVWQEKDLGHHSGVFIRHRPQTWSNAAHGEQMMKKRSQRKLPAV